MRKFNNSDDLDESAYAMGMSDSSDIAGAAPPRYSGSKKSAKMFSGTDYDTAWKEYLKNHPDIARKAEKMNRIASQEAELLRNCRWRQ